ncbi:MAG: PTS sucrose transporter subunit IIBC [Nocardiaceae bacterium]|nr:PTS sucrose transporter subunit IIBC [Nocardiaceae bacterium]
MLADNLSPLVGTNIVDSVYSAFQQGATIGNALMTGLTSGLVNVVTTIGTVYFGSTFNNTAPLLPPAF